MFTENKENKNDIPLETDILPKPKVLEAKVEEKKVEDPKEKVLEEAIAKTTKINQMEDFKVVSALLNVRETPSDKAKIVGHVKSGTVVKVDTSESIGAWSKITAPIAGYVMTKFIAPAK